jgi:hypothetical protein
LNICKMNAVNVSVLILATMVSVLAGMVGYMYWQQNRVLQSVNALSVFISSQFVPQPLDVEEDSEDDRQSVEQEVEVVETTAPAPTPVAPAPAASDDLKEKSSAELRELLSQKGLPYGKRDSKATLLELLKAAN